MKSIYFLLFIGIFNACNTPKNETKETISFQEEIKLDSLALENIFADSTLKNLSVDEINVLSETLIDTSEFFGLKASFIQIDSAKKMGKYEEFLSKLDIGVFKDIKSVLFKEYDLGDSKSLKFWGYDFSTFDACPYTNGKVILVSTFINGKNTSCTPFSYYQNWADAPFYNSVRADGELLKNGDFKISLTESEGGVDESEKEYNTKTNSELRYNFKDGKYAKY
ncbi:hypothetical protein EGI22_08640 [Lacihabitans sp. LS3-19]|uniref:hypothetical protein n=1 Tax=Lacihabitans sp. LS3-19 TaxID=2487335 RepID=UPI0020CF13C4|nr:hypothetical protein [Lacihabitans sp. LS3-19]MCP9767978.1 hypothetical protein [Lacihabitans sp. LS3-19]